MDKLNIAGVGIGGQPLGGHFPLQLGDLAPRDQLHFGSRAGEVEVGAAVQQGRAGEADVQLFGARPVQELRRAAQLSGRRHAGGRPPSGKED